MNTTGSPVPLPADFDRTPPSLVTWEAGEVFARVYDLKHAATTFNPGTSNTVAGRFHFFQDTGHRRVSVLYGAEGEDAAISETLFHDVPVGRGRAFVPARRLEGKALGWVRSRRNLRLVELLGHGLRRLGLRPKNLTDTDSSEYRRTVEWACAVHHALPDVDGLLWMSRQFNAGRALVLFGDRVSDTDLEAVGPPTALELGPGREIVDGAANRASIVIG